nr:alpha/beta hydrolase [Rhodococcus wratislaviensis]GLK39979.1 hydrolase [Rhodococcus wratislaviensis]
MPIATINEIQLNYEVSGEGPLVVLIMGTGSPGRVWKLHQVPALVAAGFKVCIFDNRGIEPSSAHFDVITIDELVADTAALIEHIRETSTSRAFVVGTSLGARIAQELTLARPDLVEKAVFLAGHARYDELQRTLVEGELENANRQMTMSPKYHAAVTAALNLSPTTLEDDSSARMWLDVFEYSLPNNSRGVLAQKRIAPDFDRRAAYRQIAAPCLSVGFADDRMIPSSSAAELARLIPGARYIEIPDAGHYGYLEQPDTVNIEMVNFLAN